MQGLKSKLLSPHPNIVSSTPLVTENLTANKIMKMSESPMIQRCKCDEDKISRKPISSTVTPFIQTKSLQGGIAGDILTSSINSSRGSGKGLDQNTLSFMESRFGANFSNVNIHTNNKSVQLNRELNAQAFTVGNDIFFNEGKYAPHSDHGKHLLAHELTHVVQQNKSAFSIQRSPEDRSESCKLPDEEKAVRHTPSGPGAFNQKKIDDWYKSHTKNTHHWGDKLSSNQPFMKTNQWLWDRCYFYAGKFSTGTVNRYVEIWLNNIGDGNVYNIHTSSNPADFITSTKTEPGPTATTINPLEPNDAAIVSEAEAIVQLYSEDVDELKSRAAELAEIYNREGMSEDYVELYEQFDVMKGELYDEKWDLFYHTFPELKDSVKSEEGKAKITTYVQDLFNIKTSRIGEDLEHVIPDSPDEPIDFSGGK